MPEKRTSARPTKVDGIEWYCWRLGPFSYEWRAFVSHILLTAGDRGRYAHTYWAKVGDNFLMTRTRKGLTTKRFRSLKTAMRAAIKEAKHYA